MPLGPTLRVYFGLNSLARYGAAMAGMWAVLYSALSSGPPAGPRRLPLCGPAPNGKRNIEDLHSPAVRELMRHLPDGHRINALQRGSAASSVTVPVAPFRPEAATPPGAGPRPVGPRAPEAVPCLAHFLAGRGQRPS